jgi:hypothetical protein
VANRRLLGREAHRVVPLIHLSGQDGLRSSSHVRVFAAAPYQDLDVPEPPARNAQSRLAMMRGCVAGPWIGGRLAGVAVTLPFEFDTGDVASRVVHAGAGMLGAVIHRRE